MSAAIPAWKLALLERKKKQEEEEKAKKAKVEEAKIASLPAWKRAIILREKQAKGVVSAPTPTNTSEPASKITPKWQVAVERVKGSGSPILSQRPSWKSGSPAPPSSSKLAAAKGAPPPSFQTPPVVVNKVVQGAPPPSPKLTTSNTLVTNRWNHSLSSSESSKKGSKKESAKKPTASSSFSFPSTPANLQSAASNQVEEDPSLAGLPAWKKALILKKHKAQAPVVKEQITPTGEDEPDSANPSEDKTVLPASTTRNGPPPPTDHQPEVVNRSNGGESEAPSRLVEQEGKTLHPPIYKEVDEWANVKEQDDKFKELPLWKQALIKRRRADIAKRSGLEVPTTASTPPNPTSDKPLAKKVAPAQHTKKPNKKSHTNPADNKKGSKVYSHERKKKAGSDRLSNHVQSKVHTESSRPVRKAPAAPTAKQEEPMFTYNFSKSSSSRRTLDTGGSSSDSTDSDLEDAIITNLDDEPDEGDSGIVLQSYSVNKARSQPSPTMGQKSAGINKARSQPSPTMGQKSAGINKAPSQPSPTMGQKSAGINKAPSQPSPTMGQKSASETTVANTFTSGKSSISTGKKVSPWPNT